LKRHVLGEYPKLSYAKIQAQLAELAIPVVNQNLRSLHSSSLGQALQVNGMVTICNSCLDGHLKLQGRV
jgi:hypothetical protein